MAEIRVTISQKQKAELEKCGKLSDVVRKAIRMYINDRETEELELQRRRHVIVKPGKIVGKRV